MAVFSYRGLDQPGNPLPYPAEATHQALQTSAALLAQQVDRLYQRTGKPVAIVDITPIKAVPRRSTTNLNRTKAHHEITA